MTQSPSPSVDEVADYAAYWHGQCQAIATLLGLPEPEEGFAGVVRDHVASLVSPPKAGEPVAWQWQQCKSAQPGVWPDDWNNIELRPGEDRTAYWKNLAARMPDEVRVRPLYANHEARGDGVRVTDEQVETVGRMLDEHGGYATLAQAQAFAKKLITAALSAPLTETAKAEPRMPHSGMTATEAAAFIDEQAAKAEHVGAEVVHEPNTAQRAIELWFFRDLSDEQRYKLGVLAGLPGEAWPSSQNHQRIFLRHLLSALFASPQPSSVGGEREKIIEECAKVADAVAKEIKAKGWPQYAAQQCASAIRAKLSGRVE